MYVSTAMDVQPKSAPMTARSRARRDKKPPPCDTADAERHRRGYIVTRTGVRVGLTAADAGSGFALVKLAPNAKISRRTGPVHRSASLSTAAACRLRRVAGR